MLNRSIIYVVFILCLILVVIGAALYWWGAPRLVEIYPSTADGIVPAGTSMQLTFSRPIEPASLETSLVTEPALPGEFVYSGNTLTFTPDQPWPSGQTIQVKLSPGVRAAGWLPIPQLQEQAWSFTASYPLLAYIFPVDAPADLYALDPNTGEIQQLTDSPGAVLDFSLNETGTEIYYNTSQGDGGTTIYRLDRLATESQVILRCPQALCRSLQVSPDGNYLAYERTPLGSDSPTNTPQVWLLPLEATEDASPAHEPIPFIAGDPGHKTQQPQWSSKGLLSYYDFNLSAFIVQDLEKREVARFPSQTGIAGDWHPSGEYYTFPEIFSNEIADPDLIEDFGAIPSSRLLQFHLDGSSDDLTGADDVEDASPAYSPNGDTLAFGRKFLDIANWTPGRQLWLMQPGRGENAKLTDAPQYNHYDFAWHPDGVRLAYSRFNKDLLTDPPEIWLVNADGTDPILLVTGGYAPQWIP